VRGVLTHYWRHLRHYPHFWVPLLVITPIASVINNFAVAWIAAGIIDRLSRGSVPADQVWSVFGVQIVLFIVAIVVGELVLWRLVVWLLWSLEARMVERLYADCFDHLSRQSATFFADRFVGSMVSTVNKFTSGYITAIDTVVFQLLPLLMAVAVPVVVLAPTVPVYSIGVSLVTVTFAVVSVASYRPIGAAIKAETEAQTAIGGRLADVLANVLVVKSFSREPAERGGFADFTGRHRRRTVDVLTRHTRRDFGFGAILSALLAVTLVSILWGQATGAGVGTLVVMLTFSLTLFGWLWEIPQITRMYNRVYGDASPMIELFGVQPDVIDPEQPEEPRIAAGRIVFDGVTFGYPGAGAPVFRDLALEVAPGERVGLVGPSGSGKTSVTRLLLRFFDPATGTVRIDGQDIRRIAQHELRSRIAFVPQEPLLFHRSIAENIRYGRPDADEASVLKAAERAQVLEFVTGLDDGLDTLVGERGVKLSGGQRQRIAIARAILSDAPILVLDEATSALDSLSEGRIQAALDEAMRGRTTIAIAHRLSTLRSMTRLVVLAAGAVVEDGTHESLLRGEGVYAAMWERQSGGFVAV
jgi:ATP-binding cassette subfamily B protein